MKNLRTCLWFDTKAEEAANFYASVLPNSKVGEVTRFAPGGMRPEGMVMTVTFLLAGQEFVALNGGPDFKFNPSISMVVACEDQVELDRIWDALSADPTAERCGWLKDKYGMSWQIVPASLEVMLSDPDPARVARVTAAMLQMHKLDIHRLEQAFVG